MAATGSGSGRSGRGSAGKGARSAVRRRVAKGRPGPAPAGRARRDARAGRLRFPGLSPRAYEHPADRAALVALAAVPGFDKLLRTVFGQIGDRSLRLAFLASAVRVGPRQFGSLHRRFLRVARVLDMEAPELYVAQTPVVNGGALGVDRPFVVVHSGALQLLDGDEMEFFLGHELGHVLSGHAVYKTMLRVLLRMSLLALSVPLGGAALLAISGALLEWDRKSELTADRAGLLACQSLEVALRVHMKLAGGGRTEDMSLAEFEAQAAEYEAGGNLLDSLMKLLRLTGATHPFPVLRIAELRGWVDSGGYASILERGYPTRDGDRHVSLLETLRASRRSYAEDLRRSPDPLARLVRDAGQRAREMGAALGRLWGGAEAARPRPAVRPRRRSAGASARER